MEIGFSAGIVNWRRSAATNGPFSNHATLTNGLVSYWNMDELSGVRSDSVVASANDLTDNNTVGNSGPLGPTGVAAVYVAANSETLQVATPTSLENGKSRSLSIWIYLTDALAVNGWAQMEDSAIAGTPTWIIHQSGANTQIYHGRDFQAQVALTVNQWSHLVYTYEVGVGWVYYANGVLVDSGPDEDNAADKDASIFIGSGFNGYTDGRVGPTGMWSSPLNQTKVTSLYNAGIAKDYSDLTTAEKVNLVSYWNLNETSGNRADSHGSNTLTDTNTVTSLINAGDAMNTVAASFARTFSESLSHATAGILTSGAARTISMWFREDLSGSNQSLVSVGGSAADAGRMFNINTGGATPNMTLSLYGDGGAVDTTTGGFIATGIWYHLVYTYPGGTGNHIISVDDVVKITDSGADSGTDTNFFLGTSSAGYWQGLIDEIGVWSRVLTAAEITALYNAGDGLFY